MSSPDAMFEASTVYFQSVIERGAHVIKALKVLMEGNLEDFFPYNDTALHPKTLLPHQGDSVVSVSDS